jgi:hypothetical protein
MARTRLQTLADTVQGLIEAASLLKGDAPTSLELQQIIERGEFRPAEDEAVGYWFARFLTIRESLWSVIDDVRTRLAGTKSSTDQEHRYFIVGYASVCVLVGIDRLMLFDVAKHSIIQRPTSASSPGSFPDSEKFWTPVFGNISAAHGRSSVTSGGGGAWLRSTGRLPVSWKAWAVRHPTCTRLTTS